MDIALVGATGNIGGKILAEALSRGHRVTALVRRVDRLPGHDRLTPRPADVFDKAGLAEALRGHDAVVSAVPFRASDPDILIAAVRASGVRRWVVVGGAGSLEAEPGVRLVDTPDFPAVARPEALRGAEMLERLRRVADLDWSFQSPSAVIAPGERTGRFRLGTDRLLRDADGRSRISQEDYAVALLDELERPAHIRQRFTVGY